MLYLQQLTPYLGPALLTSAALGVVVGWLCAELYLQAAARGLRLRQTSLLSRMRDHQATLEQAKVDLELAHRARLADLFT